MKIELCCATLVYVENRIREIERDDEEIYWRRIQWRIYICFKYYFLFDLKKNNVQDELFFNMIEGSYDEGKYGTLVHTQYPCISLWFIFSCCYKIVIHFQLKFQLKYFIKWRLVQMHEFCLVHTDFWKIDLRKAKFTYFPDFFICSLQG